VHKGGRSVNGKSPLDMLLLVAEQGCELTVETSGPDAAVALEALVALLVGLDIAAVHAPHLPSTG
jgi:phosphotransferase system HPr (HPr) family protein